MEAQKSYEMVDVVDSLKHEYETAISLVPAEQQTVARQTDPAQVATELVEMIQGIEEAIEGREDAIREIENRGFFKRVFGNKSKDLVNISRSQNTINTLLLGLIREVITLNVMSYSFLAAVLHEFDKMVREGWKDQDGRIRRLSDNSTEFAETASNIFHRILDGSRETHLKIEQNARKIDLLRSNQAEFQEKYSALEEDLARLQSQLRVRGWLLSGLTALALLLTAAMIFA